MIGCRSRTLAAPFARHLCEHLSQVEKQTTSQSSQFLDACRAFNKGDLSEERLVQATVKRGFNNVIDAFHIVGSGPVPVRFFADERKTGGVSAIRLTDDLRRLATSVQGGALSAEAESRWRLVETAWQLNLPRAGVAVQADLALNLLFVERIRRVNLTPVRPALNGYQRGKCFYCQADVLLTQVDVDHFFPWVLKERGVMPDADGVWALFSPASAATAANAVSSLLCRWWVWLKSSSNAIIGWWKAIIRCARQSCCRPDRQPKPGPSFCDRARPLHAIISSTNGRRLPWKVMTDPVVDIIGYYDRRAADFAAQTAGLDLEPVYQRFLRHVGTGGRILDVGCGAGRDALAFADRGYDIVALDASDAMVKLTRDRVGARAIVHHMRLQDLHWQNEFDGIWACASLLHVPTETFTDVAIRLAMALRRGGAWYMSFKLGTGERVTGGRLLVDHTGETLRDCLCAIPVEVADIWISEDVRAERKNDLWLNAVAVKEVVQPAE